MLLGPLVVAGCQEINPEFDGPAQADQGSADGGTDSETTGPTDTGDGEADASSDETSGDDGGGKELLQNHPALECDTPLWCFQGNPFNPVGDPTFVQECFSASLTPPFELVEVAYVVAGKSDQLAEFDLEVREFDGVRPGQLIEARPLDAVPHATDGENLLQLEDNPIVIDSQSFCVGFATHAPGLAGALGIAVDEGSQVQDVSYYRIDGEQACAIETFLDVIDDQPTPTGNWCISAVVYN